MRISQNFYSLLLFAAVFIAFSASSLSAQDNTRASSGSFYSSIGFGAPSDRVSPFSAGMGLTGVSIYSPLAISSTNPAQWGLINFSQGTISAALNQYDATDFSSSASNAFFGLENFQIAFPLLRNELGFSFSFSSVVRSDFNRREQGTFSSLPGLSAGNVDYVLDTVGSGGINRFEAGIGYRLTRRLTVGYAFAANLMSLNTEVQPLFSDAQFRTTPYNSSTKGNSLSHRFGIYGYTGNIFGNNDQLEFGATISLPFSFDAERSVSAFRVVNNQRTRVELNEGSPDRFGTVKLPLEFNTGLTYNLSRFTNVVGELLVQRWDDAEYSFEPSQEEFYKDRIRAGLGFQYHPYRVDGFGGLLSKLKYSLGATYDTGHLSINNQNIETIFLNAGIGLMSQRYPSSIDLSFHYGIRGTESSNLVKENIWGFKISLNMAEMMFLRQRFQ